MQENHFKTERKRMVENQISMRGVRDGRVLAALESVPRHLFVPESLRRSAYADSPLPIGYGQTISQPYIVAFMTEALKLEADSRVLEVGTGSGYQCAVLSQIASRIYSMEYVEGLYRSASKILLEEMELSNVVLRHGNGYDGWPEEAPFDRIIITAAPTTIPGTLVDQLKEGGVMILPVGDYIQELIRIERKPGGIVTESLLSVRFVPMVGEGKRS